MSQTLHGSPAGEGRRIAIAVSDFNEFVTRPLVAGALAELSRRGVDEADVLIAHVPGAFELPAVARRLSVAGFDAVICLGAVIRGDTDHYTYVCEAAAAGIAQVSLEASVPVLFGVLTCDTAEQAMDRAGGKAGNKGEEVARAALELADLYRRLPPPRISPPRTGTSRA